MSRLIERILTAVAIVMVIGASTSVAVSWRARQQLAEAFDAPGVLQTRPGLTSRRAIFPPHGPLRVIRHRHQPMSNGPHAAELMPRAYLDRG